MMSKGYIMGITAMPYVFNQIPVLGSPLGPMTMTGRLLACDRARYEFYLVDRNLQPMWT